MEEPQQQTLLDDEATLVVSGEERTLVAPRFDDEETLVARPVVPLGGDAPAHAHVERHFSPRVVGRIVNDSVRSLLGDFKESPSTRLQAPKGLAES